MALLRCPNCTREFRNIGNLGTHRRKVHPIANSASIRNGIRNSPNNPSTQAEALTKCVKEIAGLATTVTPAIVARDVSFAPAIVASILRTIDECRPLVPSLSR